MKKIISGSLLVIVFGLGNAVAEAQVSPQAVVANLYRAGKTKSLAEMNKSELRKYFAAKLADSIWKASHSDSGLDFDILYNAQDTKITNFKVGMSQSTTAAFAIVPVSFNNFGKKATLIFDLRADANGVWKIFEITYSGNPTSDNTLSKILETY